MGRYTGGEVLVFFKFERYSITTYCVLMAKGYIYERYLYFLGYFIGHWLTDFIRLSFREETG